MGGIELKNFDRPDESREFAGKGRMDLVQVAGKTVGRAHFEPGWRWTVNIGPIVGADACETSHLGYCVSGTMRVTMKDGTVQDFTAGDLVAIQPGHDAEVVGDEPVVFVDFGEITEYAKPR
ncbi:cupin [Catellatospora sp. IY07-71]|uniref:cupin domain-containing protein n=1 Tax=Catellatospora sp. IY07-71 TaxID=2728827 RepID=UPI001BB37152|nr:cupin domain-containing protein [Catellatospora sp. IY07-71]BCJ73129.1 cupin [Catellatospora sp. IY07-71]